MVANVLCDLAGKKVKPEAVARLSRDRRNKLYQNAWLPALTLV
ncbi:hypothetical protein PR003_g26954 [Phytophthora rubi]|uniref:Uncharacterized protein n=2 Tax=Phytophthora TaxID=4783 RepID=A0A6A3I225_9STRA|nr:hypothetical protein PR002_g25920 [Phytophthora rubi]KAE8975454.1 hypothetical protein PR001_g25697 [Phytophthora rubi]KAE9284065.1 hypothetical protein PR003_g26954 [Phytophthora rubi]KAE9313824.1 hypothetical protein PF008_g19637 [Phytophthora fragariae]